ncbi:MAG TPA: DUF2703 domain-containing protein [Dissulfurispiraceae bacterium]|nr:DUF2703 domain-containing protein [Dissulfurispiraceae bacterium]
MKTVTVEWFYLNKDGKTCSRCAASADVVRKIVKKMTTPLKNSNVELNLREIPLPEDKIADTNAVKINGTDVMDILGEKIPSLTDCPSCSELIGKKASCRSFFYKGQQYDVLPELMLEEAILAELASPSAKAKAEAVSQVICSCQEECSGTHPVQ